MAKATVSPILQMIRRIAEDHRIKNLPDQELLRRFTGAKDDAAFACLLRRHGAMVLDVCRNVTGNDADAEDAFQATFLILAQKAKSIRKLTSVGSWLYGVAYRTALKAQQALASRRKHEPRAARPAEQTQANDLTWPEIQQLIHTELAAFSERYRAPLVLCFLEGKTQDDAARHLGISKATLKKRLERGRAMLRLRLIRRGLGPAAVVAASAWPAAMATAGVPSALVSSTVKAAAAFALGQATAGLCSAQVTYLLKNGLQAMLVTKLKIASALVVAFALLPALGGWVIYSPSAEGTVAGLRPEMRAHGQENVAPIVNVQEKTKENLDRFGDPLPQGAVLRLGTVRFRSGGPIVGFLPDSKTLISSTTMTPRTTKQGFQIWEATTGKLQREIAVGADVSIRGVAMSPDCKRVAAAVFLPRQPDEQITGAILILDTKSGRQIQTMKRTDRDVDHCSMAFTSDGKLLLSAGDNGILRVEDVDTGKELQQRRFPSDGVETIAMSPDNSTLAINTGPNTRKLFLWKWQTGEEPHELKVPDFVGHTLVFSPDSKTLLECGDIQFEIRAWDVPKGKLIRKLSSPDKDHGFKHATYTPDGKTVVTVSGNGSHTDSAVHLWDAATWQLKSRLDSFVVANPCVSRDGRLLAGSGGGGLRVWDLAAGKELSVTNDAHQSSIGIIAASSKLVVTTGDDHTIRLWDAASGQHLLKLDHGHWVRAMALSPDGSKIASSSLDNTVCLWDVASGKKIFKLPGHGRLGGRRAVSFTPDGKHFLSWGDDMYLRKWEVATGKAVLEHYLPAPGMKGPKKDANSPGQDMLKFLAKENGIFSPDGNNFVLGTRSVFHVFDVAFGKELYRLPNEGGLVISTAISPDSRLLLASAWGKTIQTQLPGGGMRVSTAQDHPLCLWELATRQIRQKVILPDGGAGPVAFSPDGKFYAAGTGGAKQQIRIWEMANGRELAPIQGFQDIVRSLAFSPDSTRLISGMDDTTALVWDLKSKR